MRTTRTRFAPSPTGFAHVGSIRTALFAYLLAKQQNGQFILRLEDTDQKREVVGSADHLIECLVSLGLNYDEGPKIGGPVGPYTQSERLDIYKQWAQKLIDAGRAYADPYSSEELQAFRDEARANKKAFLYRDYRPENPPVWDGTTPLRFKSEPQDYTFSDAVMGEIHTGPEVVDDFILIKSDGFPTYNFAHIVDDAEMNVSHVIRGQEFISSMPNYLNLYDALGIEWPIFAHMPHIMNEQGNKKLGKRDGAKDVLEYVKDGYLPEALISFIATLGWNDGTEQEVFTKKELIDKFSLERVGRSGARFDERRLLWVNGQVIRSLSSEELSSRVERFWPKSATTASSDYRQKVLQLCHDRLKTLQDLPILSSYFFEEPVEDIELITTNKQLKKLTSEEIQELLSRTTALLQSSEWNTIAIQASLNDLLEETGQKPGVLFSLIRVAVSWAPFSPPLPETLALLGKDVSLARIDRAQQYILSQFDHS